MMVTTLDQIDAIEKLPNDWLQEEIEIAKADFNKISEKIRSQKWIMTYSWPLIETQDVTTKYLKEAKTVAKTTKKMIQAWIFKHQAFANGGYAYKWLLEKIGEQATSKSL